MASACPQDRLFYFVMQMFYAANMLQDPELALIEHPRQHMRIRVLHRMEIIFFLSIW